MMHDIHGYPTNYHAAQTDIAFVEAFNMIVLL